MNRYLLPVLLLVPAFAGCIASEWDIPLTETEFGLPIDIDGNLAAADIAWPDFDGETLRILDHGAFPACESLGEQFKTLTGATVECTSADDTGSALSRAMLGIGDPEFDILYGADNLLMHKAVAAGIFEPYTPQLAGRVQDDLVFFGTDGKWPATPVDHGYIALNIDHRHDAFAGAGFNGSDIRIEDLFDVRAQASQFVTQDPRTSTPGLGFMLVTIRAFGEDDSYDWQDYWTDLFENDVKITSGWSEAYETHFSGGYGVWTEGHVGDRPIVTSYTQSPAYEAFYDAEEVADVLYLHGYAPVALHQIQTMGILAGTEQIAIAQAWIEFSLTDDFQVTAAPDTAVYPATASPAAVASVNATYGDDPAIHAAPGTFDVVDYSYADHGDDVERWVAEWVALCEAHSCI